MSNYYAVFLADEVTNYGPPAIISAVPAGPGDFDNDGDVDQSDFGHFQTCLSGSSVPQTNAACFDVRFDADEDVDQGDLSLFLGCMSGADSPADPYCVP